MEMAVHSAPLLFFPSLLAGVLIAAGGVTWLLRVRRRGRLCPRCHATTICLVPGPLLRILGRAVFPRWCPGCGWEGLAIQPAHERRGPDGKVRLKGGFRWGLRPPPRPGFFSWSGEDTGIEAVPGSADRAGDSVPGDEAPTTSTGGTGDPDPSPEEGPSQDPGRNLRPRLGFRWRPR